MAPWSRNKRDKNKKKNQLTQPHYKKKEVNVQDQRKIDLEGGLLHNLDIVERNAKFAKKRKEEEKREAQEGRQRIGMVSFDAVRKKARLVFADRVAQQALAAGAR